MLCVMSLKSTSHTGESNEITSFVCSSNGQDLRELVEDYCHYSINDGTDGNDGEMKAYASPLMHSPELKCVSVLGV